MADSYKVGYLQSVLSAVIDFQRLLKEFLELHERNEFMPGLMPSVVPKEDADPNRIDDLRGQINYAAGAASEAAVIAGGRVAVAGFPGPIDPITNWRAITEPKPVVDATTVLDTTDYVIGRLRAMITKACAEEAPTVGAASLHPLVWGAAKKLWGDRHYRQAVVVASDAVEQQVRSVTGRYDLAATAVWNKVFSAEPPKPSDPRLRWPGDPSHQSVKSMQDGLLRFSAGVQLTVRNQATHDLSTEYSEQEGLERLATLSLLARWVDGCDLVEVEAEDGST